MSYSNEVIVYTMIAIPCIYLLCDFVDSSIVKTYGGIYSKTERNIRLVCTKALLPSILIYCTLHHFN